MTKVWKLGEEVFCNEYGKGIITSIPIEAENNSTFKVYMKVAFPVISIWYDFCGTAYGIEDVDTILRSVL